MIDRLRELERIDALPAGPARDHARALAQAAERDGDAVSAALFRAAGTVGPDPELADRLIATARAIAADEPEVWDRAGALAADLAPSDTARARYLIAFAETATHRLAAGRITEIVELARQAALEPVEAIRVDLLEYDARFGEPQAPRLDLLAQLRRSHREHPELAARVAARCALDAWWHYDTELAAHTLALLQDPPEGAISERARLMRQFASGACSILLGADGSGPLRGLLEAAAPSLRDPELEFFGLVAAALLNEPVPHPGAEHSDFGHRGRQLEFAFECLALAAAWRGETQPPALIPGRPPVELDALSLALRSVLAAHRGDVESCRELAVAGIEAGIRDQHPWAASLALAALGRLELSLGSPDAALTILLRIADPFDSLGHPVTARFTAADLAEAALRAGRVDIARAVISRLEGWADQGCGYSGTVLARFRAMVAEPGDADQRFEEAVAHAAGSGFEEGRTRLVYGEYLRRTRRRVRAREELRIAQSLFARLDAEPWAARAQREIEASAETARRGTGADEPDLTQRERQIAELVAAGASNQEAADRLIMSRKTVEHHLSNIYSRLGIASRDELAGALGLH